MKFKSKIIIVVAIITIGALGWFGYRQILPEAKTAKVFRGTVPNAVPANVVVSAEFTMEIKSEHGGRVLKRPVIMGQEVKAGDVIFEIDSADLQLEIERIEADYKAAQARIALGSPTRFEIATAEETLKNSKRMLDDGRLAPVDFDRAKRNVDVLNDKLANDNINNQQTLDTFENTLKQKRRALEKMKVIVREDGTVIELDAEPGALVSGGQVLARVISRSRRIEAQISEENFSGVRPGLLVAVQFLGYYGRTFTGKVEGVLPNADEKTKRYTAYLNLDMPAEMLAPGLTGDAVITIDQRENALKVERRSLVGSKLYVVRSGRVRITPVQSGYQSQTFAEVISGVQEGDEYIADDQSLFHDGQLVRTVLESEK